MSAFRAGVSLAAAVVLMAACRPPRPPGCFELGANEDLRITLCSDPSPPYARETTNYRAIVRDSDTGQPIENGEGQIYTESKDGVKRYDALLPAEELGTYAGELRFITAGTWMMGLRFRRDSTQKDLRVFNWQQDVREAREGAFPGDTPTAPRDK